MIRKANCLAIVTIIMALAWAGAAQAQVRVGVTIYEHGDFRGRSDTFYDDVPDLRGTHVGADGASSVRVPQGCQAVLYSDANFRGASTVATSDISNLGRTSVGNDSVSSIQVSCGPNRGRQGGQFNQPGGQFNQPQRSGGRDYSGVTLFWRPDFHGRSHFFHSNHPNLGQTEFGRGQASSIILDEGCRVVLYDQPNFRGRSAVLTRNSRRLGETSVGDNTAASIEVSCR